MSIEIRRLTGAIGARVTGIDLREPLDDGAVADIRKALLDHEVLIFRDQTITPSNTSSSRWRSENCTSHRCAPSTALGLRSTSSIK